MSALCPISSLQRRASSRASSSISRASRCSLSVAACPSSFGPGDSDMAGSPCVGLSDHSSVGKRHFLNLWAGRRALSELSARRPTREVGADRHPARAHRRQRQPARDRSRGQCAAERRASHTLIDPSRADIAALRCKVGGGPSQRVGRAWQPVVWASFRLSALMDSLLVAAFRWGISTTFRRRIGRRRAGHSLGVLQSSGSSCRLRAGVVPGLSGIPWR